MIEDHWETRQDYIKAGNEMTRLANQQEQEKKEQERIAQEQKAAQQTVVYQANNVSGGANGVPVSVPMKHSQGASTNHEAPVPPPTSFENSPAANQNLGMRGFQNASMNSGMGRPMGQSPAMNSGMRPMNQNPFMSNNRGF